VHAGALLVACAGCAAPAVDSGAGRGTAADTRADATAPAPSRAMPAGLELVRWFVPIEAKERSEAIARAVSEGLLAPIDDGDDGSAATASGFLLFRAPTARLPELKEALGGSPQVRSVLLGTLTEWADLESVRVESGRPIFFNGRPRIPGDTLLRLWLRGWCFPTVDGARARAEVRLTSEDRRQDRVTLDPTMAARPRLREVDGGRSVLELAPGESLVILEKPIVPPEDLDGDPLAVLPPPTIAALLLAERAIPGRATILIVNASFADMLPPSEAAPSGG